MKRLLLSLLTLLIALPLLSSAQVGYSTYVDSVVGQTDTSNLKLLVRQLSGDTAVLINGQPHTFTTRYAYNPQNELAEDFIAAKFTEYGYTPEIQSFRNDTGQNIIATKPGLLYPYKYLIISGHYDSHAFADPNFAPGADDNASGTAAMLEAARLLKDVPTDYSIRFIAFDMEEMGLWGSFYYAQQAALADMDIVGVINLDMLGYNSDSDYTYDLCTEDNNSQLTLDVELSAAYYFPWLITHKDNCNGSDQYAFWASDYPAIGMIEAHSNFNPDYHTVDDVIGNFDFGYYFALAKTAYSALLANALDYRYIITHQKLLSTNETSPRLAEAVITGPHPVAQGDNRPRLYYSTDSVNYEYALSFESVGDTFCFMIPGVSFGTTVNYYFSVQDEEGNYSMTFPYGGYDTETQGSVLPPVTYSYLVDMLVRDTVCSVNTPLPLPTSTTTYDEFTVGFTGRIEDLDVMVDITHTATRDLKITLTGPDNTSVILANQQGGPGDNYTQTVFDDDADLSIIQGAAPFTGHYRPIEPLGRFRNKYTDGTWKLAVNESNFYNAGGSLNSWCLHFFYADTTVGIIKNTPNQYSFRCYPNPVKDKLEILFTVDRKTHVKLAIYSLTGTLVKTLSSNYLLPGNNLIVTPVADLLPGIYFIRASSGKESITKKLVVVR